ncbi:MAG TPA: carboxypeptidase-like regulatory domain-containing protein [Pirellulales bacterium]|nr:carboxypeptidase-like regulatory domain-containing protein [Pirellulales bacterium]
MQLTSMNLVNPRIAMVVCLALCGCNRAPAIPKVQTLPVTGTVTLDNKPLAGAVVLFTISDPPATFFATTKEDGTYQLQALEGREASLKGRCEVTISRMVKPDGSPLDVAKGEAPAIVGAVEQLPQRYSMPGMSELTADVPEGGGTLTFDFDLKSK